MEYIIEYIILALLLLIIGFFLFILIAWRRIVKFFVKKVGEILLTDEYQVNILEMIPGFKHIGFQNIIENGLRAETGDILHRPIGSSKVWQNLDSITFIPAQTTPFPIDADTEIDLHVQIGPKAKKPMKIKHPLLISGMAYGVAISEEVQLSLTQAANNAGTAISSGEGGILPEVVKSADKFIYQLAKSKWSMNEENLKHADMIEIKLGQGAYFGIGANIPAEAVTGRARTILDLEENEPAVIYNNFFADQSLKELKELVKEVRQLTDGVPIGVKIGAGGKIEKDIDHLLQLDLDYIAIDGGQAGTKGSPPILQDDMGIPTLHAVARASKHLEKIGKKEEISLIVSGGLYIPGHFLKMLALGADAVYLGTALLFAISHTQSLHPLPFEPPTQVVWYQGKFKEKFSVEDGTKFAENYIKSSTEEMKIALRAMGKRSLNELSKKDLVSYDEVTARMLSIPFSFEAWVDKKE